jgi:hypothetical protein
MLLKDELLAVISRDPISIRNLLVDSDVAKGLNSIGVLPKILELHAPSRNSRTVSGLGRTLCGINGTRHQLVTCKQCLKLK